MFDSKTPTIWIARAWEKTGQNLQWEVLKLGSHAVEVDPYTCTHWNPDLRSSTVEDWASGRRKRAREKTRPAPASHIPGFPHLNVKKSSIFDMWTGHGAHRFSTVHAAGESKLVNQGPTPGARSPPSPALNPLHFFQTNLAFTCWTF